MLHAQAFTATVNKPHAVYALSKTVTVAKALLTGCHTEMFLLFSYDYKKGQRKLIISNLTELYEAQESPRLGRSAFVSTRTYVPIHKEEVHTILLISTVQEQANVKSEPFEFNHRYRKFPNYLYFLIFCTVPNIFSISQFFARFFDCYLSEWHIDHKKLFKSQE